AWARRLCEPSWSLKKSWKSSSTGEAGGNCGRPGVARSFWFSGFKVCVVEILTTAGSSLSAKSAKLSGAGRAAAGEEPTGRTSNSAAIAATAECRNLSENKGTWINSSDRAGGDAWLRIGHAGLAARLREKRAASQIPRKRTPSAAQ